MPRTRFTKKKAAKLALVAGSFAAAGFLASGAQAACIGGVSATHCTDPTRTALDTVGSVAVVAGPSVDKAAKVADSEWRDVGKTAAKNGLPDPGKTGVPTLAGPLPPIGPIGPGPVGDGLRTARALINRVLNTEAEAARSLPGGGDVSVPTLAGPLPPIGPIGPGPVGDELRKELHPILGGGGSEAAVTVR